MTSIDLDSLGKHFDSKFIFLPETTISKKKFFLFLHFITVKIVREIYLKNRQYTRITYRIDIGIKLCKQINNNNNIEKCTLVPFSTILQSYFDSCIERCILSKLIITHIIRAIIVNESVSI